MESHHEQALPMQGITATRPPEGRNDYHDEGIRTPSTLGPSTVPQSPTKHELRVPQMPLAEEDSDSNYENEDEGEDFYALIDQAYGRGETEANESVDRSHEYPVSSQNIQQEYIDEVQEAEKRRSHWGLCVFDNQDDAFEGTIVTRLSDLDDFFQDPEQEQDPHGGETTNGAHRVEIETGPSETGRAHVVGSAKGFHERSSSLAAAIAISDSLRSEETEQAPARGRHRRGQPITMTRNSGMLDLTSSAEKTPHNDIKTGENVDKEGKVGDAGQGIIAHSASEAVTIHENEEKQKAGSTGEGPVPPYEMREKESSKSLKQKALNIAERYLEEQGGQLPELETHPATRGGLGIHICSDSCCHAPKDSTPAGSLRGCATKAHENGDFEAPFTLPKRSVDPNQSAASTVLRRPSVAGSTRSIKDELREKVQDLMMSGREQKDAQVPDPRPSATPSRSGFLQKIKSIESFRVKTRGKVYTSNEEMPEIPRKYQKQSNDGTGPEFDESTSKDPTTKKKSKSSTISSGGEEEVHKSSVRKLFARVKPQRRPTIEANTGTPFLDGRPQPRRAETDLDNVPKHGRPTPRARPLQKSPPDAIMYSVGNLSPTKSNGWGMSRRLEAHEALPTVASHQALVENVSSPVANIWAHNPSVGYTLPTFSSGHASLVMGDPLHNARPLSASCNALASATEGGSPVCLERSTTNATSAHGDMQGITNSVLVADGWTRADGDEILATVADGSFTSALQSAGAPKEGMTRRYVRVQMPVETASVTRDQVETMIEEKAAEKLAGAQEMLDERLAKEEDTLTRRLDQLEKRVAAIEAEVGTRVAAVEAAVKTRVKATEARMARVEAISKDVGVDSAFVKARVEDLWGLGGDSSTTELP